MLNQMLEDIYFSKQMREDFKSLEEDEEVNYIEDEVLEIVDNECKDEIEDLLVHLEARMMKIAYKKGFTEGLQTRLDLNESKGAKKWN